MESCRQISSVKGSSEKTNACVPMLINAENYFFIFSQVFGLGNKTYEHYNKVAIYVDKRLEELGGSRVFELGLGDDDAK